MIVIIVFVFDPLAIILLVAANREQKLYSRYIAPRKRKKLTPIKEPTTKSDKSKVVVGKNEIFDMSTKQKEIPKEILDKVFKNKK